MKQRKRSTQ